jgi:hypothetical protein
MLRCGGPSEHFALGGGPSGIQALAEFPGLRRTCGETVRSGSAFQRIGATASTITSFRVGIP